MSVENATPQDHVPDVPAGPQTELAASVASWPELLQQLTILFKLRVVSLLLLAAVGGAFLGAGGWPGWAALLLVLATGGMAASGAAALNQYLERQHDAKMGRTRQRPLVTGVFNAQHVLIVGLALIIVPVVAVIPFNPALAFFLLAGALIYVGIYTIWLKQRTLLNIVIGGAAGSAAVMSGGAAVDAWQEPAVIVLALLVFLWTPSHFWSLAILYHDDYEKAGTPMLPTLTSQRQAGFWVAVHTVPTGLAALLLAFTPTLGWVYFIPVALATIDLFRRNLLLIWRPSRSHARGFFASTNLYLMIVLVAIIIDSLL